MKGGYNIYIRFMKNFFLIVLSSILMVGQARSQDKMPTAEEVRLVIEEQIRSLNIPAEKVYRIEERRLGRDSIKIRIYYPDQEKNHRIIYNIHGGAFVAGDLDTHDNISRILANRTRSVVVAVDYRRPVGHPFPASIEDCQVVLEWIRLNAASIHGNADDLVLLGDSAGGLFVAALGVKLGKQLGASKLVLINPALDLRNYEQGPYALVTSWYMNGKDPAVPLASPAVASDLSAFPPTLIITAELDFLKPQGVAFAKRLQQAGRKVGLIDLPGEDHLGGFWAAAHARSRTAIDEAVAFIQAKVNQNEH